MDCPGDDVPGRERLSGVITLHEAVPILIDQPPALSAHRFGDEKGFMLRMIQTGGMELSELHVGNVRSRPPSHGHSIPCRDFGIGGILVDSAAPAGAQNNPIGAQGQNPIGHLIVDVEP